MRLYGSALSRAQYCLWLLEELGESYEHIDIAAGSEEAQSADYLPINPNGTLPALRDGDLVLWESMAINMYLARRYGGELWPGDEIGQALALQWTFWAMTEVEPGLEVLMDQQIRLAPEERDLGAAETARQGLARPMKVLDGRLAARHYLLDGDFSIADLNVASVVAIAAVGEFDLSPYAQVTQWLERCLSRPARLKVAAMMAATA